MKIRKVPKTATQDAKPRYKTVKAGKSTYMVFNPTGRTNSKKGTKKTGSMIGSEGATGLSNPAQSISQSPIYYDYRYSTPDKFYFPRDRTTANSIWRDIYRRDAVIAIATDMYAELPWSEFGLEGIDDPSIRRTYENMFSDLNLVPKLPNFTKDFMITGELILHNIFNSTKGYWEKTISHNPDYIRVQGLGLAVGQPLLWMRPTPEIRSLIHSADPRVRKFLEVLPRNIINAFRMNKEIPLDGLNTAYIPRLNTSSDVRGTSIYTRLYRFNMYEDFIVNSSLAVAQRNASPIRLFKIGDPSGNWMPSEDDISSFAEMLSLAEVDPLAAIITHPHVEVDYVGVSDRALLISREWDFIERVKLLALGVAKSFLVGETSFAAAIAGLQTLLERLATLRYLFEKEWMIEKLCKPVAEMHEFYERPQCELEHRIRIEKPQEKKLIIPKIKWYKNLEPTQDISLLGVWRDLKERGMLSERTYAAGAGLDIEVERRNIEEERKYKEILSEELGMSPEEVEEGGLGSPGLEGASLRRRANPYAVPQRTAPHRTDIWERIEAELEDTTGRDGKLHIDDVMELIHHARTRSSHNDQQDITTEERRFLPPISRSNLLIGEGW